MTEKTFLPQLETLLQGTIRQELAFANTEYRARVDRVLAKMKKRGLDVLITGNNPNICYLTGFQYTNTDYANFLLLRSDGHAGIVVAGTEVATVLVHGWIRDAKEFPSWDPAAAIPLVVDYIREWKLAGGCIGLDQRFEVLDPRAAQGFRDAFPEATFTDASEIIIAGRTTKSPSEIAHLQKAAHYSDIGMLAALSAVRPGTGENDIAAAASDAMILAGSEYFSTAPMVAAGERTGLPHAMFKRTRMARNDAVTIELAGVFQRYSAPLSRTILPAKAPAPLKSLAARADDCLQSLIEGVEPGRPIKELAKAVRRKLGPLHRDIAPMPSFGYSIGVGLAPSWKEDWLTIDETNARRFEPGMAFYSPIRLCIPGRFGVCFGDSWLVTKNGAERLSNLPFEHVEAGR
ncbi:MAG: aminopeptidase P family protein [Rhodospirillales bacterium]|nr:aminopeptidase P family protein [Rhodospirillales bacterium]